MESGYGQDGSCRIGKRRAKSGRAGDRMNRSVARKDAFLATGRRVIDTEANALLKLSRSIGRSFGDTVELLSRTKGRIIVSGIGKSGHIARKVAATLASTGSPAHYVHPAEASHGDLGMLGSSDSVLAFSNSGETPELADLIAYASRLRLPLAAIIGKPGSTLEVQSDVAVVLPPAEEACGIGIVPTTSTSMALAVGDAIAVSLMEFRKFTPTLFREFHPGGSLGLRLSKVRDLMHVGDSVPFVSESAPMPETLLEMSRKGFGVVGILSDDGRLAGIITDGDLRRHMASLLENRANEVMTRSPLTIMPNALAEDALALMNEKKITCLFVVADDSGGVPDGILHIHDCLRAGVG